MFPRILRAMKLSDLLTILDDIAPTRYAEPWDNVGLLAGDPAQQVTVRFKNGEVAETKKGILPLRHSIIVNNREYRFTVEEGSRSFAKVVYDSCAYP